MAGQGPPAVRQTRAGGAGEEALPGERGEPRGAPAPPGPAALGCGARERAQGPAHQARPAAHRGIYRAVGVIEQLRRAG